jgi:D-beta-D-heptose 7-phosphate kinase/D-beta-D-heptose 1-phosphate adenosyltransferase
LINSETIKKFAEAKILIVGDVMLDRYWWGNVNRISPEAPVPVVSLEKTSLVAGGAANVAANVAGLGAQPYLVGITGEDEEAEILPDVLEKANITNFRLFPIKNRKTTIKTRIIAHNQQVVRIDQETNSNLSENEAEQVFEELKTIFADANALIISDYAKGFLIESLLSRLIRNAKAENKIILVDPKGKDYEKYKNSTLLTPNQREVAEACGLYENDENLIKQAESNILDGLNLESLLITQGERGMTLLQKGGETVRLKAIARRVYDVTGAGDTVIATMAVALASGFNLIEAAEIANFAAGLVVEKVGTTAVTQTLLENEIKNNR